MDKEDFNRFRNRVTAQLRKAKAKHYESEFQKTEGDIKGTWMLINNSIKKQFQSNKKLKNRFKNRKNMRLP